MGDLWALFGSLKSIWHSQNVGEMKEENLNLNLI